MNTSAKSTLHAWRSASPSPIGWERVGVRAFFFGLMLFAFCSGATTAFGQTAAWATTDAADYPPGSTVYISGGGFAPGETVQCQVLTLTQPNDDLTSPAHQPWTTTADNAGNIATTWYDPLDQDELNSTLQLTATGQMSGLTAQTTFTDANCKGATVSDPSSATKCVGDSVTFSTTATCGNAPAACTLTYQWEKNSSSIAGATQSSYTIASVTAAAAPGYDCIVTGTCSPAATSTAATLTVNPLPACSISGPTAVCASSTGNTYSGPASMPGYS